MKAYPTLPSCIRERECGNRECKIMFSPKNAKAKFHCEWCKNREGYLSKQDRFSEEYRWFKAFLSNVNIIEKLVALGYEFVTDDILNVHRFVKKIGKLPVSIENVGTVVLYGKYYFKKVGEGKYQIIKNETDESNRT